MSKWRKIVYLIDESTWKLMKFRGDRGWGTPLSLDRFIISSTEIPFGGHKFLN